MRKVGYLESVLNENKIIFNVRIKESTKWVKSFMKKLTAESGQQCT